MVELGDVVLHFGLMLVSDRWRGQALEDVWNQAVVRLQPFQASFDAGAPGFDFHLPFQDHLLRT